MTARVGRPAPDFKAEGFHESTFKSFQLSDFRGRWVVLCFYPGDFTFVWPTELAAVAVRYPELQALGVQVMTVSTDTQFVHKAWHEEELSKMIPAGIPFPMLSDAGGRLGTKFGVFDEEAGVDIRGHFLIDPDGVIQAAEILAPSVCRNFDEMLRQIKAFQHVRTTGEVTPAGWRPGLPALKPRPELVGKVWQEWKSPLVG